MSPVCHKVVKKLFQNDIDPVILEDLKMDKELKITMKKLEIEPFLLRIQFWENLDTQQRKKIRGLDKTESMNDIFDKKHAK